ncbi:hypothetical protein K501DRAFT_333888 [Backusella circina FSU 941]|nr:hypothetical protein K501DRAFT_333888 [Backusella circina FSU 941]
MSNDGWSDYSFETDVFKYNYNQFITLRTVTLGISCLSLISSICIFIIYLYMLLKHHKKANRVSLRCVFLCSVVDALSSILNIISTHRHGDTTFCRATGVILVTTNLLSASLLTIVGLNLVLIFVLKVERTNLLERFYYPGVIVYSLIGTIGPIHQEVTESLYDLDQYSCWYYMYIADRTQSIFSWMWFYGFLFFANIIAIICSIAAMTKLMHEHRVFDRRMDVISKNASPSDDVKIKQNKVFTKVVLRCIIYPLVPFLVNIFGFILQMVITTSTKSPGFGLAMLDIVFTCIEGFFVAIVFFTDPTVTAFLKERFHDFCNKYVYQYTLVHTDHYEIIQKRYSSPPPADPLLSASSTIQCLDEKTTGDQTKKSEIPIRRIKLEYTTSTPITITISKEDGANLDSINNATGFSLPPSPESKFAYIPYRYPRLATYLHWLLRGLGIKPKVSTEDGVESPLSSGSSHIDMPLISRPRSVLLT